MMPVGLGLDEGPVGGYTLADDPSLMVQIGQEDLDRIDNELFEPLDTLDEDMREMCIDMINEKVRRILSVDPSKFKGGKLPFGLRADKDDSGLTLRIAQLEAELEQSKADLANSQEENRELLKQMEAARRALENIKAQKNQPQVAERPAKLEVHKEAPPSPISPGRGRGGSKPEEGPKGKTDEEVMKLIAEAKQELQKRIAELEKEAHQRELKLKEAMKKEEEAQKKAKEELDRANKAERALSKKEEENDGGKNENELEQLKQKLAKAQADLLEMSKKGAKKDPGRPSADFGGAEKAELEQKLEDAREKVQMMEKKTRTSYAAWQKGIAKYQALASVKDTDLKKKVEEMKNDELEKSGRALEDWGEEVFQYVKAAFKAAQAGKPVVQEARVESKEVVKEVVKADPEDAIEIKRLNARIGKQQEEISRLLITIDELRSRIESVKDIAVESPPEVAAGIQGAMKKAGLKEIMEAKAGPKLKGVFERLYQDAIQRIQRLGLIRERMLIANKAYSNIVNAIVSKGDKGMDPMSIPDLDRLSSTAEATLSGMWYNTDFLFRNTCDYAIAQGVESSLMKSQKLSLSEVIDASSNPDAIMPIDEDPNSPGYKARRRGSDRPTNRRGGERGKSTGHPGTTTGGDASHAFWDLPGGIKGPKSPRTLRKEQLSDPAPSSFASYIAALREARGDLRSDEWNRVQMQERIPKASKSDGIELLPKTLKASVSTGSRSLPILPKGRGILQAEPPRPLSAELEDVDTSRDF